MPSLNDGVMNLAGAFTEYTVKKKNVDFSNAKAIA